MSKSYNKNLNSKGITLVALVVTIVIMLILAATSIMFLFGDNGIVDRARGTRKIQDVASIKEALELEKGDIFVENKIVNLDNYLDQISNGRKSYDLSYKEKIDDINAEIVVNDNYKFAIKDKENGDVEIIYLGVITPQGLVLSEANGTYTYPTNGTFKVIKNISGGELTVNSSAPNIATASISGDTITVVPGTTAGKTDITVKSAANGEYAENKAVHIATVQNGTIELSAIPYEGIYDEKEHNALSSVNVKPSDSRLEYSLDGIHYSENMPTIVNTSSFTVTVKASKAGYKTQTTTETVKVDKAEGKLTLSSYSGKITYPNSEKITVTGYTGNLSVTTSNSNIATANVSGSMVTVTPGTTEGKATITVTSAETDNYTKKSAIYEVTVQNGTIFLSATPYTGTYDGRSHNAITKVTVIPSDAKIEYSTNGNDYNTSMPTIVNTSSFTVTVKASKAGYKTQTTTETVKVNKANGSLTLSAYSGTITYPNSGTFTINGYTGNLSVTSSNTNVATVSLNGNTVTINSVAAGSANITVKSAENTNYTEKTATYNVTVNLQTFTATSGVGYYADVDGNGTVDGIIFGDHNVGASGTYGYNSMYGSYSIGKYSTTKQYYISKTNYSGPFGTKSVLAPVSTSSTSDRFLVMALKDVGTYTFSSAQNQGSGNWKVPSISTWSAFGGTLNITTSNYAGYGLQEVYWSSTTSNDDGGFNDIGFCIRFKDQCSSYNGMSNGYGVRLYTTF